MPPSNSDPITKLLHIAYFQSHTFSSTHFPINFLIPPFLVLTSDVEASGESWRPSVLGSKVTCLLRCTSINPSSVSVTAVEKIKCEIQSQNVFFCTIGNAAHKDCSTFFQNIRLNLSDNKSNKDNESNCCITLKQAFGIKNTVLV